MLAYFLLQRWRRVVLLESMRKTVEFNSCFSTVAHGC